MSEYGKVEHPVQFPSPQSEGQLEGVKPSRPASMAEVEEGLRAGHGRGGGIDPCKACKGTGKCSDCSGSGKKIVLIVFTRTCDACEGKGKCSECGGSGKT